MRRHGDRQRQCTLGAGLFHQHVGTLDGLFVAGDDHLARRVEVDRGDHLSLRRFFAVGGDGVIVQPDDGGHGTGAFRHGFLHGQTTQLDQFDRIGKGQCTAAHQGGVLTQAVASHHGGVAPPCCCHRRHSATEAVSKAGWVRQVLFRSSRTIHHQGKQVITQHLARLGEGLLDHGMLFGQLGQHADGLGALSRKAMANWVIIDSFR